MICDICGQNCEYDEGEDYGDGFTCYDCIKEDKFGDLKLE